MKPKTVGLYMFVYLYVYFFLLIFLLGAISGVSIAFYYFLKGQVFLYGREGFLKLLKVALIYGAGTAFGICVISKIRSGDKRSLEKKKID